MFIRCYRQGCEWFCNISSSWEEKYTFSESTLFKHQRHGFGDSIGKNDLRISFGVVWLQWNYRGGSLVLSQLQDCIAQYQRLYQRGGRLCRRHSSAASVALRAQPAGLPCDRRRAELFQCQAELHPLRSQTTVVLGDYQPRYSQCRAVATQPHRP